MKLIITIDTEEDNWLPYSRVGYTTNNALRIPRLQKLLLDMGVRPTYLVTWQMTKNPASSAILREIHQSGGCEIGAHCHPWSQPPYEEAHEIANSMLCNLPSELQARKIVLLHEAIQENLGLTPTSFRSGRWGYSPAVSETLRSLDYKVDSSIAAHTDWTECLGPNFSSIRPSAYRFDPPNIFVPSKNGKLLELPGSVGYLQSYPDLAHAIFERVRHSPLRRLRILGILDRLRMLNKVSLTPELSTASQMADLVGRMCQQGMQFAVLWFHSSTLMPGLTPYVKTEQDAERFMEKIREFILLVREQNIESITLSEADTLYHEQAL